MASTNVYYTTTKLYRQSLPPAAAIITLTAAHVGEGASSTASVISRGGATLGGVAATDGDTGNQGEWTGVARLLRDILQRTHTHTQAKLRLTAYAIQIGHNYMCAQLLGRRTLGGGFGGSVMNCLNSAVGGGQGS